jgi:hypothetical protein
MNESIKPQQIVIAGRIMWALYALGSVLILIGIVAAVAQSRPGVMILIIQFLIAMALLGLLIRSVLAGKNWARIVYALVACIAVAVVLMRLVSAPELNVVSLLGPAALIGLYSAVLWLLFHPASRPWFRREKT